MTPHFTKTLKGMLSGKLSRRFNGSPSNFKSIEVDDWRKLAPFCPFCKGENTESALDERPDWEEEEWICQDCHKRFAIQARVIITYEEKESSDGFTVCPLCGCDEINTVDRIPIADSSSTEAVVCLKYGAHFGRSYKTFIEFEQETVK